MIQSVTKVIQLASFPFTIPNFSVQLGRHQRDKVDHVFFLSSSSNQNDGEGLGMRLV